MWGYIPTWMMGCWARCVGRLQLLMTRVGGVLIVGEVLTRPALMLLPLGSSSKPLWGRDSSLLGCRQLCTHPPQQMRSWWVSCWLTWALPAGQKLGI